MMDDKQIFNMATDISNLVLVSKGGKCKIRASIMRIAIMAIWAYRENPDILDKLQSLVEEFNTH